MQALDRHRRRIIYTREVQVHVVIRQVSHLCHFEISMNSVPEIARFWSTPVLSSPVSPVSPIRPSPKNRNRRRTAVEP